MHSKEWGERQRAVSCLGLTRIISGLRGSGDELQGMEKIERDECLVIQCRFKGNACLIVLVDSVY